MTTTAKQLQSLRDMLIAEPEVILQDPDLMRALVAANDAQRGDNIVDLRAVAMHRLEARLDRLEDTHRSVIAAAYDNLAGTNQVHRAILRLLDPDGFEGCLQELDGEVARILGVDSLRLVLESAPDDTRSAAIRRSDALTLAKPGAIDSYLTQGRGNPTRQVTLRRTESSVYFDDAAIHSEAVLTLDLGTGQPPAMLLMGSADVNHFRPNQGTDLLAFFAGIFERSLRRWLA